MTLGMCCFWDNCVEDILTFAHEGGKLNKDNCYISLLTLENIHKELNDLSINNKIQLRVILSLLYCFTTLTLID